MTDRREDLIRQQAEEIARLCAKYDELHCATEGLLEAANIRIRQLEAIVEARQ